MLKADAIGVVSLTAIDRRHRTAEWGVFLDEAARAGMGLEKINGEATEAR